MAKIKNFVSGVEQLSLGISIVVAIVIGVGFGYWVKSVTGWGFMLWVGLGMGLAAAVLNVYKAYQKQIKSLDELKDENRYHKAILDDEEKE